MTFGIPTRNSGNEMKSQYNTLQCTFVALIHHRLFVTLLLRFSLFLIQERLDLLHKSTVSFCRQMDFFNNEMFHLVCGAFRIIFFVHEHKFIHSNIFVSITLSYRCFCFRGPNTISFFEISLPSWPPFFAGEFRPDLCSLLI